jgi:hypothetical protein
MENQTEKQANLQQETQGKTTASNDNQTKTQDNSKELLRLEEPITIRAGILNQARRRPLSFSLKETLLLRFRS